MKDLVEEEEEWYGANYEPDAEGKGNGATEGGVNCGAIEEDGLVGSAVVW